MHVGQNWMSLLPYKTTLLGAGVIVYIVFTLLVADSGSIPRIPYGPLSNS